MVELRGAFDNRRMKKAPLLLMASALACGIACLSDDDRGAPSPSPSPSSSDTASSNTLAVPMLAAAGGTLRAAGATLVVPPGALAADTTLTATLLDAAAQPDAENIVAKVYDFGPAGTIFQKPVTLTFELAGAPPAGKVAEIAFLEGGVWQRLDSTITGNEVEAQIAHFTPYTVLLADEAELPDGGEDEQADGGGGDGDIDQAAVACTKDFTPCGGDLVGTWKITAGCAEFPSGLKDGTCQSSSTSAALRDIASTSLVTFNTDMTYSIQQSYDMMFTHIEPSSCYDGACPADTTDNGDDTCTKTALAPKLDMETGTYKTAPTIFSTTGKVVASEASYCVQGSTLYWATRSAALETYYTLTKQ